MARKHEKLVYDPLYRMKPATAPAQAAKKEKTKFWTAVVRLVSFGRIEK